MAVNEKNAKKESKYKFNVLDALIIILVILCIVGVYFRSNIESWIAPKKELDEFKITVVVEKIKSTSNQYLSMGEKIYLQSGVELGTIESFSSVPAKTYVNDATGKSIEVNYPEGTYIDVTVVINCRGTLNEDGFYVNGTQSLSPGSTVNARTEIMDFSFTVVSIDKVP